MKSTLLVLALLISSLTVFSQVSEQGGGTPARPAILSPEIVPTVFARLGMLTSVTLKTDKPVTAILKGGPEVNVQLDGKVIHIQPLVPVGLSSITFTVDDITYVVRVRITQDIPELPNPVFTFSSAGAFVELDAALAASSPLKPSEVDLNGAIRVIERASNDLAFKRTIKNYAIAPIGKIYRWNDNDIHFLSAHQFAEIDLIVFKVSWVNMGKNALYLNADQYRLYIGDRRIQTIQRRQLAPRSIIFPGQQEVVWLAVQGYKLRLDNDWELNLPMDANALRYYTPISSK